MANISEENNSMLVLLNSVRGDKPELDAMDEEYICVVEDAANYLFGALAYTFGETHKSKDLSVIVSAFSDDVKSKLKELLGETEDEE